MASIEHGAIAAGLIHTIANWEYADGTARLAATGFVPGDIGKWAWQQSDNSYWLLTDDSPITWVQVTFASGTYQPLDSDLTAFAGKTAPSGAVVGTTDSQTLTNKTLTSPAVTTPTGIVKGDVGLGNVDNTSDATKNAAAVTLTNKTLTAPTIADFTNAGHDHLDTDDGGTLTAAAIADFAEAVRDRVGATLVAGTNVTITVDDPGDTITIDSSGGGGGGGTMSSFSLAGDSGTGQTISDGNTLTVEGGTGIDTVAGATDKLTVNIDSTVATLTGSQTLTNKTLTTPTIASLTNATHTHLNSAGGGTLTAAAVSDFTEASQDVIGAMVAAAGGSYNDGAGTIALPGGLTVAGLFDTAWFVDDFGSGETTSGQIGALGWTTASGATSAVLGEAGHPGITRRSTSTTINTLAEFRLSAGSNSIGPLLPADFFDLYWLVRLNTNDSDTLVRVGLMDATAGNPAVNGIYFEKLAADTQWFGVTRAASSTTRTAALASVSTSWVVLRVRRKDASTISFSLGATLATLAAEVDATLTIPTAALMPASQIRNAAAAAKTIDFDLFILTVAGTAR